MPVKFGINKIYHSEWQNNQVFGEDESEQHMPSESAQKIEVVADELDPSYLDLTMKKKWRWLLLFFASFMVMPNYFCYDNPAALQVSIEKQLEINFA